MKMMKEENFIKTKYIINFILKIIINRIEKLIWKNDRCYKRTNNEINKRTNRIWFSTDDDWKFISENVRNIKILIKIKQEK